MHYTKVLAKLSKCAIVEVCCVNYWYPTGINFYWNLSFAILLMAKSLYLNSAHYHIFRNPLSVDIER